MPHPLQITSNTSGGNGGYISVNGSGTILNLMGGASGLSNRFQFLGDGSLKIGGTEGTANYVLTSNGAGNAVTWSPIPAGSTYYNSNIGSGYRWVVPNTNNIKTAFAGYGIAIDSTTNTNGLTFKTDTSLRAQPYGIIYAGTSMVSGDFVAIGSPGYSFSGGNILFTSSGNSNYSQSLDLPNPTMLERFTETLLFSMTSKGAATYGPAIGTRSIGGAGNEFHLAAEFDGTNGSNSGKVIIKGGATPAQVAISTTGITWSAGDSLLMTLEKRVDRVIATVKNVTSGGTEVSATYIHRFSHGTYWNTGRFSVWELSPNVTVNKFRVESQEIKNAEVMVIGDSKSVGYYASDYPHSWVGLLKDEMPNVAVHAGGGDRTTQVSASIGEILRLHPKRVIMAIGSNDIRNGVFSTTRYDSIVTALTGAGIQVFHLEPFYETTIDQSALLSHLRTNYSSTLIPIWDLMKENYQAYLTSDGTHLNDTAQVMAKNAVVNSYKIPVIKTMLQPDNWIANRSNRTQEGSFNISGYSSGIGPGAYINNRLNVGPAVDDSTALRIKDASSGGQISFYKNSSSGLHTMAVVNSTNFYGEGLRITASYFKGSILTPSGTQTLTDWINVDNSANINFPLQTASRPLKLDASKYLVSGLINLSSSNDITGTAAVGNGGTGATTFTSNALLKGNGTSAISSSGITDDGTTILMGNRKVSGFTEDQVTVSGTTYTLSSANTGQVIYFTSSSAITLTVPTSLVAGFTCTIKQMGTGQVTFSASGTTIINRQSFTKTAGQGAVVSIAQSTTSNTFITQGDMSN